MKIKPAEKGEQKHSDIIRVMDSLYELFDLNNYRVDDVLTAMITISINKYRSKGTLKGFISYCEQVWENDERESP